MTTRAELRQRIRDELNDNASVKLWGDALLNQWIVEGLRELGRRLGLEKTTSLTSVASQEAYGLPADALEVIRVEHPASVMRVPGGLRSGEGAADGAGGPSARTGSASPSRYELFGGQLVLVPPPATSGDEIRGRYRGAYAEPSTDGAVLDVPARDEDLVVAYACSRALQWIGTDEAKRQRFERSRGADPSALRREYERDLVRMLRERRWYVGTRRLVAR